MVKNPPANAGDAGSIPGGEDPLEKEVAAHASIPAWEIHGQRSLVAMTWRLNEMKRTKAHTSQHIQELPCG